MTQSPIGAHLAPRDLPPPAPAQDPREPPSSTPRKGSRTPQPISPVPSRGASPQRSTSGAAGGSNIFGSGIDRAPSHEGMPMGSAMPLPLHAPTPKYASPNQGIAHPHPIPHHHHLSRPSSASSMHSSTSAIFERDIEHPSTASSLTLNPAVSPVNPVLSHKPSRLGFVHGSALDFSVPAVLDDAVEALTATSRGIEGLEIEAPAPMAMGGTGMARVASGMSGRKASSTSPMALSQTQPRSGSSSPISTTSGVSSLPQSPPILAQLGTGAAVIGTGKSSPALSPTSSDTKSPLSLDGPKSGVADIKSEPLKDEPTARPVRPAAPTRMSTGKQVPGGWLSSWTREEEDAPTEAVQMGEGHAHPGPGEVGVGLERTAGLLGEQERVVPVEELPTPPLTTNVPLSHPPSSPPPASAIPHHLTPSHPSSSAHNADPKRRISFISPTDLLLSVPTSVTSLGEIASGNLSPEHVHINGAGSPAMGRSPRMSTSGEEEGKTSGMWAKEGDAAGAKGEWGREGLGRGLEQRLEELEMAGQGA